MDETKITFWLSIPAHRLIRYYEGATRWVQVRAFDGRVVRFPASVLRRFVTEDGVEGTFEMTIDDRSKLLDIRMIDSSKDRTR